MPDRYLVEFAEQVAEHVVPRLSALGRRVANLLGVLDMKELSDVVLVGHSFGAIPVLP